MKKIKKTNKSESIARNGHALAYTKRGLEHMAARNLRWFDTAKKTSEVIDFTAQYLAGQK
jgi:hypothetical protein